MTFVRTFCVAELEVELRAEESQSLDGLSGYYDRYPSSGRSPDLLMDVRLDPEYAGSPASVPSPGFDCSFDAAAGLIRLQREDSAGTVAIPSDPDQPVRARYAFRTWWGIEAAIRIAMSIALPRRRGMIMHASAVTDGTQAWAFSGVSGAGKSTIANLLMEANPSWVKLSDELLILRESAAGAWRVHVAPFKGDQGLPHGRTADLAGLYLISHAGEHRVQRLPRERAVGAVLRNTLAYVAEPQTAQQLLNAASRFAAVVPCYALAFARDPSVSQVLKVT